MKAKNLADKKKLIKHIMEADLYETVDLSKLHNHFTEIRFTYDRYEGYSWTALTKYGVNLVFPSQSSREYKTFKRLNGAKRNFIRRL